MVVEPELSARISVVIEHHPVFFLQLFLTLMRDEHLVKLLPLQNIHSRSGTERGEQLELGHALE